MEGAIRFLRKPCPRQREWKVQMSCGRNILGRFKEQQGRECSWRRVRREKPSMRASERKWGQNTRDLGGSGENLAFTLSKMERLRRILSGETSLVDLNVLCFFLNRLL